MDTIPSLAFVVESIGTVDLFTFVISSEKIKVLRIFDFESQKKSDDFYALFTSINVVTDEQILSIE